MNPHLEYGQAIPGRCEGRGIGIIDTVCLIGLVYALPFLAATGEWPEDEQDGLKEWFRDYTSWLTTSSKGIDERDQRNNHGTFWVAQVATFSCWTGETERHASLWERFRTKLVPEQIEADGSQPLEEARTRSLSYTLFNTNAFALICELAWQHGVDLWHFATEDGRGMAKVVAYLYPYLDDPGRWQKEQVVPLEPTPQLFMQWAALRFNEPRYQKVNQALGRYTDSRLGDSLLGPLALLPGGQ